MEYDVETRTKMSQRQWENAIAKRESYLDSGLVFSLDPTTLVERHNLAARFEAIHAFINSDFKWYERNPKEGEDIEVTTHHRTKETWNNSYLPYKDNILEFISLDRVGKLSLSKWIDKHVYQHYYANERSLHVCSHRYAPAVRDYLLGAIFPFRDTDGIWTATSTLTRIVNDIGEIQSMTKEGKCYSLVIDPDPHSIIQLATFKCDYDTCYNAYGCQRHSPVLLSLEDYSVLYEIVDDTNQVVARAWGFVSDTMIFYTNVYAINRSLAEMIRVEIKNYAESQGFVGCSCDIEFDGTAGDYELHYMNGDHTCFRPKEQVPQSSLVVFNNYYDIEPAAIICCYSCEEGINPESQDYITLGNGDIFCPACADDYLVFSEYEGKYYYEDHAIPIYDVDNHDVLDFVGEDSAYYSSAVRRDAVTGEYYFTDDLMYDEETGDYYRPDDYNELLEDREAEQEEAYY